MIKVKEDVRKITVFGPGIVGMPMAALLAESCTRGNFSPEAYVQVIQRNSSSSGWKVEVINKGRSPIGGIEPGLTDVIGKSVEAGKLKASHELDSAVDSDLIIVSVQTDKKGMEPDYGPLLDVMEQISEICKKSKTTPVIISESTLAPSTVNTILRPLFEGKGLAEGENIFLGISPNRVMPGRLVERIQSSDKIIGCIDQKASNFVEEVYQTICKGNLYQTNALTAETAKTTENCYRDVVIAFSTELARLCDKYNYSFARLRTELNEKIGYQDRVGLEKNIVPHGAILLPTTGVGGHCLPKDGILLSWRYNNHSASKANIILLSRAINDESPQYLYDLMVSHLKKSPIGKVALLGASYLFDSDDTRNSPSLAVAKILKNNNVKFILHDPYVRKEDSYLKKLDLSDNLEPDLDIVLRDAEVIVIGTGHRMYYDLEKSDFDGTTKLVIDGSQIFSGGKFQERKIELVGIGRGTEPAPREFVGLIEEMYHFVQWGFAFEVKKICEFYDKNYLEEEGLPGRLDYREVRELVNTCPAGRYMVDADQLPREIPEYRRIGELRLMDIAAQYWRTL